MLARLQQVLTLGALALAAGWFGWAWQHGHPGWAVGGVLLVLGGHALVLGLEFALLRLVGRADPAQPATPRQLLRAWWGEVLAAPRVFCWRQPFRSRRFSDSLPARAQARMQGRRGVLLVHGFVCNRGIWNPWLQRLQSSGTPVLAVNLEPVFGPIDAYTESIERAVQALEQATGLPPVVVAHSMGGLALRRWWAERGDDARVHRAITLGTPHHGTWLARFAMTPNARQMRLGSRWLQTLAAREPPGRAQRFTCFYSHCDNIVFPAAMATLAGADNRHIPGVAHVHMAEHPEPWQELQRWLQAPVSPPPR